MKHQRSPATLKWLLSLALFSLMSPDLAGAIEIHEIQWGLSGQPVAYKLNPVSLLIENTAPTPFEGEIKFHQESLRGQQIGIALSTSTYIAPFEKKSIQFYPYITDSANNWIVSWDDKNKIATQSFLSPRPGTENVMVQLIKPDSLDRMIPGIKRYADNLFPPFPGALDSLDEVILDYIPTWDKSRRTTFLQWIYSGGVVHVFQNSNGDTLLFPESYAPLTSFETPLFYGNGVIHRYQHKLSDLPPADLQQLLAGKSKSLLTAKQKQKISFSYADPINYIPTNGDEEILAMLTELSKPKQIWYFIFLISFLYLIIVGPGYYLITRVSKKYTLYYGVYLAGTILFCLIFFFTGQRSTNRRSEIRTLVVANILPNQEIDLTTWASLGLVSGGNFDISYSGNDHIYSACQPFSKVSGIVSFGSQGKMQVEIPPNSTCSVFHRGNTTETGFNVKVDSFLANEAEIESLSLNIDSRFPDETILIYFLYGLKLYELKIEKEQLKLNGVTRNLTSLINVNYMLNNSYLTPNILFPLSAPKKAPPDSLKADQNLIQFSSILLQRALRIDPNDKKLRAPYPPDRGKLLVLCDTPQELLPKKPSLSRQEGLVLYSLEVPLTGSSQ